MILAWLILIALMVAGLAVGYWRLAAPPSVAERVAQIQAAGTERAQLLGRAYARARIQLAAAADDTRQRGRRGDG